MVEQDTKKNKLADRFQAFFAFNGCSPPVADVLIT
jgi:hypothetical protein